MSPRTLCHVCCLWALLVGCRQSLPATGLVNGTVTRRGQPLSEVSVLFSPQVAPGQPSFASAAVTDAAGRFELTITLPNNNDPAAPHVQPGALVGRHKVIVTDYQMLAELLPPPGRVPTKYTDPASTPLEFDIKPGEQSIEIVLDD